MDTSVTCVLLLILLVNLVPTVDSCTCIGPLMPQTALCDADYAMIGTVESNRTGGDPAIVFNVRVVKTLKGPYSDGQLVKIATGKGPNLDSCATISLETGRTLLFSGPKGMIRLCGYYGSLNIIQMTYLLQCGRRKYYNNCDCKIVRKSTDKTKDTCLLPSLLEKSDCFASKELCLRRFGRCDWYPGRCPV